MPDEETEQPPITYRDAAKRQEQYAVAFAQIRPDLTRIEAELDDCQRLSEEDSLFGLTPESNPAGSDDLSRHRPN